MAEPDNTHSDPENLSRTPLYLLHRQHEAKFGAYAGFEMPLFYKPGIIQEHLHTREHAGMFDVSHMMHVQLTGKDAANLIERLCPLDAGSQAIGQARYSFLLNEQGGIIDDLIVTRLEDQKFLLVCNAGCAEKDWAHINNVASGFSASAERLPRGFIALQGPKAHMALAKQGIVTTDLSFMQAKQSGDMFISRTGYTGEDGFEIALPEDRIEEFAEQLLADDDVMLIGLAARDSLRLEAGLSLYGQDLDEETTPMEAGLTWAIPAGLRDGGPYIGADAIADKRAEGRKRKRIGLIPEGRSPVRTGATIKDSKGRAVGSATSGGFGPSVGHAVTLAMVRADTDDTGLVAEVRGREIPMKPAKLPFHPHSYKK